MTVVVLGVGNPDRGDDGAGPAVAGRVAAAGIQGVQVLTGTDPVAVLDAAAGARGLHVVDACRSGAAPGTVHRLDANAGPLPYGLRPQSSHGLGIADALELARALGRLPPIVKVYAIEAGGCELGAALSPAVEAAVAMVAAELAATLGFDPARP